MLNVQADYTHPKTKRRKIQKPPKIISAWIILVFKTPSTPNKRIFNTSKFGWICIIYGEKSL